MGEKLVDLDGMDHLREILSTLSGGGDDVTVDAIPTEDIGGNIWLELGSES